MSFEPASGVRAELAHDQPSRVYYLRQEEDRATVLYIVQGEKAYRYLVEAVPTEISGHCFRLSKQWGFVPEDVYYIRIADDGDSCDCPGGDYTERCKHVAALRYLLAKGELKGGGA
jgi:hypothetical protein